MNKPRLVSRTKALKLIAIGNSTGLVLPKEVLARLQVAQGDSLSLTETEDGLQISRHDPEFDQALAVAREVMERRRKALRELAK